MFKNLNNNISINSIIFILVILLPLSYIVGLAILNISIFLIGLLFIIESIKKNNFDWLKNKIFLFLIFFILIATVSSFVISPNKQYYIKSIVNLRFVLLAAAIPYILEIYEKKFNLIKKYYFFIVIIVCLSIFFSIFYDDYSIKQGLLNDQYPPCIFRYVCKVATYNTSPNHYVEYLNFHFFSRYGGIFEQELILGTYVSLIGSLMIFFSLSDKNFFSFKKLYIILILSIFTIFFSGERAAFIFLLAIIFFNIIFNKSINKNLIKLSFLMFFIFVIFIFIFPNFKQRWLVDPFSDWFLNHNPWLSHYNDTIQLFLSNNILFGTGVKSFREICTIGCSTHPHHYLLEILLETGFIGIMLFLTSVFFIFKKFILDLSLKNISSGQHILLVATFSILIAYLFPIKPSGSFFSSWYGSIFYFLLGNYLYISKLVNRNSEKKKYYDI